MAAVGPQTRKRHGKVATPALASKPTKQPVRAKRRDPLPQSSTTKQRPHGSAQKQRPPSSPPNQALKAQSTPITLRPSKPRAATTRDPKPKEVRARPLVPLARPGTEPVPPRRPPPGLSVPSLLPPLQPSLKLELNLAHIDARPEVVNRKPPEKPANADAPFDHDQWMQQQMKLTLAMSSVYQ